MSCIWIFLKLFKILEIAVLGDVDGILDLVTQIDEQVLQDFIAFV